MGDPAGVGPEIVVRACASRRVSEVCRPIVFGDPKIIRRAVCQFLPSGAEIHVVPSPADARPSPSRIFVIPCGMTDREIAAGVVQPEAGRIAAEAVIAATKATLAGECAALATAPLSKEAMHLGGFRYPGHTELLAEICGVEKFAMLLYLAPPEESGEKSGLAVAHVTLHTAMREIFGKITRESVFDKILFLHDFLTQLKAPSPRIAVAALNPHASEHGIFGAEEEEILRPAIEDARRAGINVFGPLPADTLFVQAAQGNFDGVVAMYHDQGHIPIKLLGMDRAVNVTVGLPIIRTSVAHGTAFDIAWQGRASPDSMIEAIRLAAQLARVRQGHEGRVELAGPV